jgi:hypothetical protein
MFGTQVVNYLTNCLLRDIYSQADSRIPCPEISPIRSRLAMQRRRKGYEQPPSFPPPSGGIEAAATRNSHLEIAPEKKGARKGQERPSGRSAKLARRRKGRAPRRLQCRTRIPVPSGSSRLERTHRGVRLSIRRIVEKREPVERSAELGWGRKANRIPMWTRPAETCRSFQSQVLCKSCALVNRLRPAPGATAT